MVTLIGAISFVKQNPPQKDIEAAITHTYGMETTDGNFVFCLDNQEETDAYVYFVQTKIGKKSLYDYYTNFEIPNKQSLNVFICLVDSLEYIFDGKNIYLTDDIEFNDIKSSMTGESISYQGFCGTFDGCGYTITGLNTGTNSVYLGLFGQFIDDLGSTGIIKNVRFLNCKMTFNSKFLEGTNTEYGCIVGKIRSGGILENCIVENPTFFSYRYNSNCITSAVAIENEGTIRNCLVKTINIESDKGTTGMDCYVFSARGSGSVTGCVFRGGFVKGDTSNDKLVGNMPTSCITTNNQTDGLDYSSVGGRIDDVPNVWYYCGYQYNFGWPMLRVFMKDWKTVNFSASPSGGGSVSPTSIQIPSDASSIATKSGTSITILGQTSNATASTGYNFVNWTGSGTSYTANFAIHQFKLSFTNSTGDISLSPSPTQEFTVNYETGISGPSNGATGTISYTFGSQTVTYDIPTGYYFDSDDRPNLITADETITPKILQLKYDINFDGVGGTWGDWISVGASSASSENITYGTIINYVVTTSNITLTMNGQQKVFTADSGYEIEYLTITIEQQSTNYTPGSSGTITVTSQIDIYACALKLYEITFADAVDEEGRYIDKYGQAGIATLTANPKTINIKQGYSVTADYNETTRVLTFEYNGNVVAIYTGKEYYAILQETDKDEINEVNDSSDLTIQPIFTFYACLVTIKNTSKDIEADNQDMAKMTVDEQEKTTHKFVVEFGTSVSVTSVNSNQYVYEFTSGQTVTFTTTDEKYEIDKYGLDEGGTSTSYTFNNTEGKQKVISPTFKVKTYKLTVESNIGEELENYEIYHGSTLIYSANLSLSDNSKFELTYNCIYNPFAKKTYKETDYFLEYYKINDVANYLDDFVIDNENIVVKSDISIKLAFTCFYTVEFITPDEEVESSTTLNSYTNPLSVRRGSEIKAKVPEYPNKELIYTLSYYDGKSDISEDVFKYSLKKFYAVSNSNDIDDLQQSTQICPDIVLSACRVYIGEVDNLNIATINASGEDFESDYVFIVEFGTEVTFSVALQDKQINSTTEKVFVYTYTFSSGQVVTYTMANNDYAMSSVIENEERKWETGLGEDGKGTEDILEREEGTVLRICPTFEHKKYSGELA